VLDKPSPMPSPSSELSVEILRAMFRALHEFRALYQDHGVDSLRGPDGTVWSLMDIEYLYEQSQRVLPPRQADSIRLFLVENMSEEDVARHFGTSLTNPVGTYATVGLRQICWLVERGALTRFREGWSRWAV
jgi:hypothetical protein